VKFNNAEHERLILIAQKNGLRNRGKSNNKDGRTAEERIQAVIDAPPILDIERILRQTFGDDDERNS